MPEEAEEDNPAMPSDQRNYDVEHYLQVLVTSYAVRLRKLEITNGEYGEVVMAAYLLNWMLHEGRKFPETPRDWEVLMGDWVVFQRLEMWRHLLDGKKITEKMYEKMMKKYKEGSA